MAPRLVWNAIVKNEAARIIRCMDSLRPHIVGYAVMDTGSTDDTKEIIQEYFQLHNIPGVIGVTKFHDFAQARNEALELLRRTDLVYDYALLVDADMQLVVNDPDWLAGLSGESLDMYQLAGTLHYQNRRLLSSKSNAIYLTPTHEFLNAETGGCVPMEKALFIDHADGSNRPEKFKRDIRILKKALDRGEEPKDRIYYYLAQSYRDAGRHADAIKWYQRRVDLGGWAEEVWSAHTNIASCYRELGNIGEFLRWNIAAYDYRPSRSESLYDIAKYFREKSKAPAALLFADAGLKVPLSTDALFVNDYVYRRGFRDEFSICAFYTPNRREEGYKMCDELALERTQYQWSNILADSNLFHYMQPLGEALGGIEFKQIEFETEQHWIPMNPSICLHRGELKAVVRTVNYRMDEDGRYLIRATDGTANNSNPINTRNWLVPLDRDLRSITQIELVPREPQPVEYPLVIGFEDPRVFDHDNNLYISATVRQRCADGLAEQTLARIGAPVVPGGRFDGQSQLGLDDIRPMLRTPRLYEKNWMPIIDSDHIRFLYRPGHIVDAYGRDQGPIHTPHIRTDSFSGGSQLIPFELDGLAGGYLGIVHEAHVYVDRPWKRYYTHRFVFYRERTWPSYDGIRLERVSRPFFLRDKVIEFVAGLAWYPGVEGVQPEKKELIISFGFKDCEAWLARVDAKKVWEFICQGQEEPK